MSINNIEEVILITEKKEKSKRPANKVEKTSYYVKNADLLIEIEKWKKSGKMSNTLGGMIQKIAHGIARKPNWSGYTWITDMEAEAVLTVLKYLRNFDVTKSNNPFAYITTIVTNAYVGYINTTKKHAKIKQALFDSYSIEYGDTEGFAKSNYEKFEV